MSVLSLLNKTCTVRRFTPSKATTVATGEVIYTGASIAGVPCKVDVKEARQADDVFRAGEAVYNFYFLKGADVRNTDTLQTVTGYTDMVFSVVSNPSDDVGRGAYLRVKCQSTRGQIPP